METMVSTKKLASTVGLITSEGLLGPNIMAAEWTFQISKKPWLMAISISSKSLTAENIIQTGKFGISIASEHQNILTSVSGNYSGRDVNKIMALQSLDFSFFLSGVNQVLLVSGSSMSFDCTLIQRLNLGNHTLFVGEVKESYGSPFEPLMYHEGAYYSLGNPIKKPDQVFRFTIDQAILQSKRN